MVAVDDQMVVVAVVDWVEKHWEDSFRNSQSGEEDMRQVFESVLTVDRLLHRVLNEMDRKRRLEPKHFHSTHREVEEDKLTVTMMEDRRQVEQHHQVLIVEVVVYHTLHNRRQHTSVVAAAVERAAVLCEMNCWNCSDSLDDVRKRRRTDCRRPLRRSELLLVLLEHHRPVHRHGQRPC